MELELRINGVVESVDVAPNESLLSLLRREGYCGAKQGCETGECGACTVLVEGVPRPSCVMLAAQAGGCSLTTVEGLSTAGTLHPLQAAFMELGAASCGFCAPGMLLSASALLKQNPHPSEADVRDALSGHLCRCAGYEKPVQAVLRASAFLRGEQMPTPVYNTVNATEDVGTSGKLLSALAGSAASASGATMQLPVIKKQDSAASIATSTLDIMLQPQFQTVGKPLPVLNARQLVSGNARFVADVLPRALLHARVLTSPHAHALIRKIDASAARALPGVLAVLTHEDVPRVSYSSVESSGPQAPVQDHFVLDRLMRYVGDRVAVVAAEAPEIAEQALRLIEVEYEILPAILDLRQSSAVAAPRLHPEEESQGIFDYTRNIATRVRAEVGDVDLGFSQADFVVEGEYFVSPSHPVPTENRTVITYFDADESLVVRTNCQAPHHIRRSLSQILGLPLRHIRVLTAEGGNSSDQQELLEEDLCALLTIATRRPVILVHSRTEEFYARIRPPQIIRMKTGVTREGYIVANQLALLSDTGAYATHPLITRPNTFVTALSLYPCAHMRFVGEVVYTNHVPAGAFADNDLFSETFALECHLEEIAARLNMDALELRRKNWLKAGTNYPLSFDPAVQKEGTQRIESCGLPACLKIVEEKIQWSSRRRQGVGMNGRFRRGVGAALAMSGSAGGLAQMSGAITRLNTDGSIDVSVNAAFGSGAATLCAQIAAEVLGVSLDAILFHADTTDTTPLTLGGGERALYSCSGAVRRAAEQMRRQVLTVAGRMLNVLPESLRIIDGHIGVPNGLQITVAQVAEHALYQEGRQLMTTATWRAMATPATFAALGVEVEVDTETGSVRILQVVSAVDVGRALNPALIEGQVQGSVTRAIGTALSEEVLYDQKGTMLTTNLRDYGLFAAPDAPPQQTYLVETDDQNGPFGAKSVAGTPFYSLVPAIANAITDALGIRLRHVPFSPERVLRAIHASTTKKS